MAWSALTTRTWTTATTTCPMCARRMHPSRPQSCPCWARLVAAVALPARAALLQTRPSKPPPPEPRNHRFSPLLVQEGALDYNAGLVTSLAGMLAMGGL